MNIATHQSTLCPSTCPCLLLFERLDLNVLMTLFSKDLANDIDAQTYWTSSRMHQTSLSCWHGVAEIGLRQVALSSGDNLRNIKDCNLSSKYPTPSACRRDLYFLTQPLRPRAAQSRP